VRLNGDEFRKLEHFRRALGMPASYTVGCSIHLVALHGSHRKMAADLPFPARGGMYANSRIGAVHFSQDGGSVRGSDIPQATAGTAVQSVQICSLRNSGAATEGRRQSAAGHSPI
jgi:hypothetical protein